LCNLAEGAGVRSTADDASLGLPVAVGLIVGTKTSRPIPKNADCMTTKSLALIFT
jgi:hypothetical protein